MQPHHDPQALDLMFHALADRNRRSMVDQLSHGPTSVSDLARPLAIALPSAVKHLAILEAGGLVLSDKVGRVRTYRLAPDAFSKVEAWVEQRKTRLNRQFDRLEQYLLEQAKDGEAP